MPTAFPYLQLYLCKTVCESLPSGVIPQDFYWVWKTYREDFPLADKLFADTLSDFFFLCGTSIGYEALGEILTERSFTARPFLLNAYLFDHLFKEGHVFTPKEIDLVLRTMTGESFRKAKAYRFHPRFPYVVEEAVAKAVRHGLFSRRDLNENLFHIQIPSEVRVERRLFQGLPEKEVPMAEISLRYVPYLHDENIRSRIDELIRYLENRIRKILKIKNSLSRIHISELHQGFLEGILAEYEYLAPREDAEESKIDAPLPSPPREIRIDFEEAAKIEEESRRITSELTRSYTSADADNVILGDNEDEVFDKRYEKELAALEIAGGGDENGFWELASTLSEAEDAFMRVIVHQGSSEARRFCAASGVFFEAMVSSCNEKAMDACDDAVIDGAGSVYEDYLDTLKSVFPPME
ncbi:MAG: hypothetical protein IKC69_00395 [Clostridia bacterium]|nr:hypothetical protein [Clostridia bacterium]